MGREQGEEDRQEDGQINDETEIETVNEKEDISGVDVNIRRGKMRKRLIKRLLYLVSFFAIFRMWWWLLLWL